MSNSPEMQNNQINLVALVGTMHGPARLRVLASGEQVVNLDLRVQPEGAKAQTLPVSWFEAPTRALDINEGDELVVVGRMRRQWFSGKSNFTDVMAEAVVPVRSKAKARKALGRAMASLQMSAP